MNFLLRQRFSVLVCLIFCFASIRCAVYEVIGDERSLLANCDGSDNWGNLPMQQLVDLSGLTITLSDDYETAYASGDIKVLMDIPNKPIKMEVDVFRLERGQWMPTILSLKRDNLCEALGNPLEFWHFILAEIIKQNQLVCPPSKGHIYTLTNVTNRYFLRDLPRWDIEGDLKAIVHFSVDQHKTCVAVYSRVYVS